MKPVGSSSDESIVVETDIFEHRQVKHHFINPCCFGEDFAMWLRRELSQAGDLGYTLSDPIQEDYGWGLWASHGRDRFWIALAYIGDGPQDPPAQWVVSVTYDPGLNIARRLFHKVDGKVLDALRNRVRRIVQSNSGIRIINS